MHLIRPTFFDNALVMFNYTARSVIQEIIQNNQSRAMHYPNFDVYYFDRDFLIVQIKNTDISFYTLMEDNVSQPYLYELGQAYKNEGTFAKILGHNVFVFAQTIAKYTDFSVESVLLASQTGMNDITDETKTEFESNLPLMIPKLQQLVIDRKQMKDIDDDNNSKLKGYCDLDFYAYMYDNKLMIACYASATMYMVEFTADGFVIYGENNSYGKELEEITNPEFEWDTAEFEPYFLKYLNKGMVIFEFSNGKGVVKNPIMYMFHSIVEYILVEENLWSKTD